MLYLSKSTITLPSIAKGAPDTGARALEGVFTSVAIPRGAIIDDAALICRAHNVLPQHFIAGGRRPQLAFSRQRFLTLRHTWTSGHYLVSDAVADGLPRLDYIVPQGVLRWGGDAGPPGSELLLHVNDATPWELPPADHLDSSRYWSRFINHRARYNSGSANVRLARLGSSSAGDNATYGLQALRALKPHEELLLHYGSHYWTHRCLSMLLLGADSDALLAAVRWIEALVEDISINPGGATGGSHAGFPVIANRAVRLGPDREHRTVLWNSLAGRRASNADVLAVAVRRSCLDIDWAAAVLRLFEEGAARSHGDTNNTSDTERGMITDAGGTLLDVHVPFKQLRRLLRQDIATRKKMITQE